MLETLAWKISSQLALACSCLPRPLYHRLLAYVLEPALRGMHGGKLTQSVPRPAAEAIYCDTTVAASPPRMQRIDTTRPRALVIDGFTPTPDKDAASVDITWFMRILLGFGYEVTFVPAFSAAHAGRYTDELRRLGITCPIAPELGSARDFVTAQGSSFELVALYRTTVAEGLIDVVRQFAPQARVVFNTVDLHFLRDQRQAEANRELHLFVEATRRRKAELAVIRSADAAVLLSGFEYDYVGRHAPTARRYFIPLAQPVPNQLGSCAERSGVLFVGGFKHAPNVDAVHFLCRDIWPLVRARLPGATLFVAGADPPQEIVAYHAPGAGVAIMGHVEDLTGLYRSVRVSVAPLRYGAGLKGKVVASLAMGLPCVVTSIASEGMPPGGDAAIAVADDPGAFAQAIAHIHSDSALWQEMSAAGVAYAHANFSIETITAKVGAMLESLGLTPHGR